MTMKSIAPPRRGTEIDDMRANAPRGQGQDTTRGVSSRQ